MTAASGEPNAGAVFAAIGEAATEARTLVAHVLNEEPGTAVAAALAAGFIAGGGLASPLGARLTAATLRVAFGNVVTLLALDFMRHALAVKGADGGARSTGAH